MNTNSKNIPSSPLLIIIIGVSGSGKSTLAEQLALLCKGKFIEADNFHSTAAKLQMSNNIPLNDEQRAPWITSICNELSISIGMNETTVLAFSGLKAQYRSPFRNLGYTTHFYLLNGESAIIANRMANRNEHFVSTGLLESQIATLELPTKDEKDIVLLELDQPIQQLLAQVTGDLFDKTPQKSEPSVDRNNTYEI